ncbi:MAG TPA: indole-3-glycerol phosphate synthase TrpC [Flavitalea sp.]|nr:indole-3-glycerol phosphate synthase TrpC [Flavitalea sp.]
MNILEQIISFKKKQVQKEEHDIPAIQWEKQPAFERTCFSLFDSLNQKKGNGIIAEFKRRSPSKGIINDKVSVTEVTSAYTNNSAAGLSVLTDEQFFGGSIEDLMEARDNKIPILRKDFIISEYQVVQSKAIGADVILLIAAVLTAKEVRHLTHFATELGLEVLLEVHNEEETAHICEGITMVGVNNRDLKSFSVDVKRSLDLAPFITEKIEKESGRKGILISESGISNAKTVNMLKNAGFRGFLMGEHFMKQSDPGKAFYEFVQELKMIDQQPIR